jgi:UDP-N-acetylmuramoyl-L-alanyl-D-glutamate--2,6-diaminopimelate ligase
MMPSHAALDTVAVLGGRGKSSVAHTLAQALDAEASCAFVDDVGYGFPNGFTAIHETDLDADHPELARLLDELSARGAKVVAVEVASIDAASGAARQEGVAFTHAVLTGLTREGGETAAATELAWVTAFLQRPGLRWAVLNLDDPSATALLSRLPEGLAVAGYRLSVDEAAPARCALVVRVGRLESLPRGLRLSVFCQGVESTWHGCAVALDLALIGTFNAANALAVLAVLLVRGSSPEHAAHALARVRGVPGRMECFGEGNAPLVVVDEAASPSALETALINLRAHRPRRVFTVFGCRGERAREVRVAMGAVASRWSDALILTDDDPGVTPADAIIADILAGVHGCSDVRVQRRRDLAIRTAILLAGTDDAVLVAGKGQSTTQDLGETHLRFSDRAVVIEALRECREGRH